MLRCPECGHFTTTFPAVMGRHRRACKRPAQSRAPPHPAAATSEAQAEPPADGTAQEMSDGRAPLSPTASEVAESIVDPGGASGDEAGVGEQHEEASWRQTEEAAKAAAAVRDEVERARLNRQLDDALSCLSTLSPTTTFGPEVWHWIEMVVRSMWSRDDARDHLAREADIRRRTGRRALPFDSQAGVYAVLDKWLEEQGMSFSAVEVTFHDGSDPHPQAVTSAMKGAPGTVTLTAYQREMVSVLRLMYTDVASDAPDHRLAEQVWRDGERVFGAPWTALYMEQQQAEVRLREPEGRIISWSLFHDKSNKFGRDFYPVFAVCNHLSLEEKRKPANWVLVAIWPILHSPLTPPL